MPGLRGRPAQSILAKTIRSTRSLPTGSAAGLLLRQAFEKALWVQRALSTGPRRPAAGRPRS
eukprot:2427381-Pyramimonas_sp.AAC.2